MGGVPRYWQGLCRDWLGLSDHVTWTWWQAVAKSRWTAAGALRDAVQQATVHPYPSQRPAADRTAMNAQLRPHALMRLVEDLVHEGVLLRRDAIKLEEAILGALDATGAWCVEERRRV